MKTQRITYLAAALTLAMAGSSCEHDEIYEPLEFAVQLSPTNTYKAGDPVVFNFSGISYSAFITRSSAFNPNCC